MANGTEDPQESLNRRLTELRHRMEEQSAAEQRRLQEELSHKKAQLEHLFEAAPEAIVMAENDGTIVHVNGEFTRLFGYGAGEVVGKNVDDLVAPRDCLDEARDLTEQASGGKRTSCEAVRRRKDGSLLHVSILAAPVEVEGRQVSVFGIYRDIGQRRRMEEELCQEKAYLEGLFESVPDAIVMADHEGRILRVNTAFTALFGYALDEVVGQLVDDLVAPEDLKDQARDMTRGAVDGEPVDRETVRRRKDGSAIRVRVLAAPIVAGDERMGVYGIYRELQ